MNVLTKLSFFVLIISLSACSSAKKWSPVDIWLFQINDTPMGDMHGKMRIALAENKVYNVFLIPNDGDKEIEIKDVTLADKKLTGIIELPMATLTIKGYFKQNEFLGSLDYGEEESFPFIAVRAMN